MSSHSKKMWKETKAQRVDRLKQTEGGRRFRAVTMDETVDHRATRREVKKELRNYQ